MIRQLRQAWKEFLKNIDVYVAILLALLLSFLGLVNLAPGQMTIQSGILGILALLAFSILRNRQTDEVIGTALEHVTKSLPRRISAYKRQEEAYKFLGEYIKHRRVREAVLIQYSCSSAMSFLRAILSCGATVTVYIQDENTSRSLGAHEQVDRILHWQKSIYTELADLFRPHCLKIYKYHVPGSVSAIKIDLETEQVLCLGWYAYEHSDASNRSPTYPSDTVQVSGHDIATVIVWSGTEEFEALHRTFAILEKNYQMNSQEIML